LSLYQTNQVRTISSEKAIVLSFQMIFQVLSLKVPKPAF